MIRVQLDLLSANGPSRNKLLGIGEIGNLGVVEGDSCRYAATFSKTAPKEREPWKRATVPGFDHVTFGGWDLLFVSLFYALGRDRCRRLLELAERARRADRKGEPSCPSS